MPDEIGRLTDDESNEIADAINRLVADPNDPCPNCGKTPSAVIPFISTMRVGIGGMAGGIQLATTICRQCGFVRQFALNELEVSFGGTKPPMHDDLEVKNG